MSEQKIVAYRLTRSGCSGGAILGPHPQDVGKEIANEIDANSGLPADECDTFTLTPFETMQAEIDALPEFEGW